MLGHYPFMWSSGHAKISMKKPVGELRWAAGLFLSIGSTFSGDSRIASALSAAYEMFPLFYPFGNGGAVAGAFF